jgi:hypothetical protein
MKDMQADSGPFSNGKKRCSKSTFKKCLGVSKWPNTRFAIAWKI